MDKLNKLVSEYRKSPEIYQVGRYWKKYENKIIEEIKKADLKELRSGKYPIFATFGFVETVYYYHPDLSFYKKAILKLIRKLFITNKNKLPYSLGLKDIREMAYNHCVLQGKAANLKPVSEIEASTFGNPEDLFEINGKKYTMSFLNYYLRLCYAQKYMNLKGNETIVELGSGSGHQTEILKKTFPDLTIICFDLPYVVYLCNEYLKNALGIENVVCPVENLGIKDLNNLEKGKVYMFGNWMFSLLKNFKFDVFWNAASFGEMEPDIVKNYLSFVTGNSEYIYLLQAEKGKESSKTAGVEKPITFDDYNSMLKEFELVNKEDAFHAHRRMTDSGGYFHAVWKSK